MSAIAFTVPGIPAPQGSKVLMRGRILDDNRDRLHEWREKVTRAAVIALGGAEGWETFGPMQLHAIYFLPRPKAHYSASGLIKPGRPIWHATRPDRDKLDRAIGDALTAAGVWNDDSQSAAGSSCKRYVDDAHPTPCALIRISPIEDPS